MTYNDVRKNENKGFSLVELIVVVAIMAVLVAVLAPSLLAYVERSRAQKDDSAMGEVANAVMLALADQDVYDEVLRYTYTGNVSCYIDLKDSTGGNITDAASQRGTKIETKNGVGGTAGTVEMDKDQYMFGDDARLADEKKFEFAGNMRGVTITFEPSATSNKKTEFALTAGKINAGKPATAVWINGTTNQPTEQTLGAMSSVAGGTSHYLYNRVRATVGDKIELTSQTYRNSSYTVFIRMGTTGGNQADKQDAIKVYGQWNGTNLPKVD
jgi:prepilin-type N-terminal cleavage/methylation domain-containing protein